MASTACVDVTAPSVPASNRKVQSGSILGRMGLNPRSAVLCTIVAIAIVIGGGGSSAPLSEMILQIGFALASLAWLLARREGDRRCPKAAYAFAGLILVLPIVQLVPLPPALWHILPGRAVERQALDLVGAADAWMPWTASPSRTYAALLAAMPPAFVLCGASMLDRAGRGALLATVALLGLASVLLGALQLADGIERTWRFYVDNPGYLNGFQANRNAQADVLLIAFAALVSLSPPIRDDRAARSPLVLVAASGCAAALLLGCVLTGSRAGIVLIAPVALVALLPWRARIVRSSFVLAAAGGAIALIACIVLIQGRGGALGPVADRFTLGRDVRLDLWRDTLPVVRSVWPMGSGIGTFRPVFIAGEPLTSVDPTVPVRAHNDYLEFLLEGGVAAAGIIAAYAIATAALLMQAARAAAIRDRPQLTFTTATLLVIALHSFVDYPLRSMAIAVLGAGASGMLIGIVRDAADIRAARSAL